MRWPSLAIPLCVLGAWGLLIATGRGRVNDVAPLPPPDGKDRPLPLPEADGASATLAASSPAPQPSQVDAAHDDALQALVREVSAARIGEDLTVGDLVERTDGEDDLRQTLKEARW